MRERGTGTYRDTTYIHTPIMVPGVQVAMVFGPACSIDAKGKGFGVLRRFDFDCTYPTSAYPAIYCVLP
jgi:hypothetical protein